MVKVSIIIPVHNSSATIERTIRSVSAQTYDDFEVLLVNNGSTDNSTNLILDLISGDNRFRLLNSKLGRSRARNFGLQNAKGELIQFLDADDELAPEKLQRAIHFLEDHPDCQAYVCSSVYQIDAQHKQIQRSLTPLRSYELLMGNPFVISSVIFRNWDIKPFESTLEYNEDWLFWVKNLYGKVIQTNADEFDTTIHITGHNTMSDDRRMFAYQVYVRGLIKTMHPIHNWRLFLRDLILCATLQMIGYDQSNDLISKIINGSLHNYMLLAKALLAFRPTKWFLEKKITSNLAKNLY